MSAARSGGHGRGDRDGARRRWAGTHGGPFAFVGRDLLGARDAAGVRGMPVGEVIARVHQVGADDGEAFLGEVAQPSRAVRGS